MNSELNLFNAVQKARQAIQFGIAAREACQGAAAEHGVPAARVSELVFRAECACQRAREALALAAHLQQSAVMNHFAEPRSMDAEKPGVSLSEYGKIIGRSASYVTKLKQTGRLVLVSERRVDVEASKKLIEKTTIGGSHD